MNVLIKYIKDKLNWLSVVFVIVPTLLAIIYFSFFAPDMYVSQASFVVRSSKATGSLTGLGAFLQSAGFSRSQDDTFTVLEYMRSRDALLGLKDFGVLPEKIVSQKDPVLSLFASSADNGSEAQYQRYLDRVQVDFDTITAISTLKVKTYTSEDATLVNGKLLEMGEGFINALNDRGRADTIKFAALGLENAKVTADEAAEKLNRFRAKYGVFDLEKQASVQLQMIGKLQEELFNVSTQLAQLKSIAPQNPQIESLMIRQASLRQELQLEKSKVTGTGTAFADKVVEYQRLHMANSLAEKKLASSLVALEQAKSEADRKQLYLEQITQSSSPDVAQEPKRLKNILSTLILGLILYGVVSLLTASVREHQD